MAAMWAGGGWGVWLRKRPSAATACRCVHVLPRCVLGSFPPISPSHVFPRGAAAPLCPPLPSADGQPSLLPPEQVQQLNVRSTGMLNNVQRLFSHHMIHTFGCDYSTGGVTLDALQAKLRNFLEICTADGPRHDTYLVFYSGHTHSGSGAWALAGERPRNGPGVLRPP